MVVHDHSVEVQIDTDTNERVVAVEHHGVTRSGRYLKREGRNVYQENLSRTPPKISTCGIVFK